MRSLANFVMSGRLQAASFAALSALSIPALSHAAVSLVALRKGLREGVLIALFALLPGVVFWLLGRLGMEALAGSSLAVLMVLVASECLRATASWSFTIMVTTGCTIITVLFFCLLFRYVVEQIAQGEVLAFLQKAMLSNGVTLNNPGFLEVTGILALGMLSGALFALILGRWWQSLLYNAGGFGEEFRRLRLGILPASVCFALMVICFVLGDGYIFWTCVFALPLLLVAVSIVHALAHSRRLDIVWLVTFYLLMVFFSPLILLLAFIGFIDTWLNIRNRLS